MGEIVLITFICAALYFRHSWSADGWNEGKIEKGPINDHEHILDE